MNRGTIITSITERSKVTTLWLSLTVIAVLCLLLSAGCTTATPEESTADISAFGSSYQEAQAAILDRAEDAVLLAVQCETTAIGDKPIWSYLFASQEMSFLYSVAPATEEELKEGSGPYEAHTYGRLEWPARDWEQIPAIETIAIGSEAALEEVAKASSDPVEYYSMYLVTYLSGDGSEDTSTTPLVWEVLVNAAETDEDGNVQETPGRCYTVDALTGSLSEKVVSENSETPDEEDQGPIKATPSASTTPA